jgi:hypothetical protein
MRNSIRSYAFAFSLIAALATSASAAPQRSGDPGDFFTRVMNIIVWAFDEAKVVIPPG